MIDDIEVARIRDTCHIDLRNSIPDWVIRAWIVLGHRLGLECPLCTQHVYTVPTDGLCPKCKASLQYGRVIERSA